MVPAPGEGDRTCCAREESFKGGGDEKEAKEAGRGCECGACSCAAVPGGILPGGEALSSRHRADIRHSRQANGGAAASISAGPPTPVTSMCRDPSIQQKLFCMS